MKCTVLSQDRFLSSGIEALFNSLKKRVNFESVIFIDIMSSPVISAIDELRIREADLLIFIVDSLSNFRVLEDNLFVKYKKNINIKYICRIAQPYEFEDLLKCEIDCVSNDTNYYDDFTDKELRLISYMCTGKSFSESTVYRNINKKTLSTLKRNVMRKLNVSTDAKLYEVIWKCDNVNQILSHLCY
ncbi:hypothetical protein ACIPMZ_16750 [Scandinavium goeteborgense]|uniref:hypothetical protein n=1 Tax=Scandinavium goeteborgense TaxID=1851514 RepID=UPI003826CB2A